MGENISKDKDKQLIKELKDRLQWYTFEATEEEFDVKEVEAIVNLLKVLEPIEEPEYFNADKGLERFWKFYQDRQEEEALQAQRKEKYKNRDFRVLDGTGQTADAARTEADAAGVLRADQAEIQQKVSAVCEQDAVEPVMEAAKDAGGTEEAIGEFAEDIAGAKPAETGKSKKKKKSKTIPFFGKRKGIVGSITAAALILAFVGGSVGYAERDSGFFHWLSKDKNEAEIIISPTLEVDKDVQEITRYNDINEVPEQYTKKLWVPDAIPGNLEFEYVEVNQLDGLDRIVSSYGSEDDISYFNIGVKDFENELTFVRQAYSNFDYLYEKEVNNIVVEYFKRISEGETEYAICFYYDRQQYFMQTNIKLDDIESFSKEYVCSILRNNV